MVEESRLKMEGAREQSKEGRKKGPVAGRQKDLERVVEGRGIGKGKCYGCSVFVGGVW
jgi:hypothetical protein